MPVVGDQAIGRRDAIGLSIGAAGSNATPSAPQIWMRWKDVDIQPMTEVIENDSSTGVVEKVSDSSVVSKWVAGTLGGDVSDQTIGYFLYGMYGAVSSTGTGTVTHTFSVNQSALAPAMTLARTTPLAKTRHAWLTFDSLEISAESKGWVSVSAAVKARDGVASTDTPGTISEKLFDSRQIQLKIASSTAGLSGASVIDARSLRVQLERTSEEYVGLGNTNGDPEFDRGEFEAKGEFVVRYKTTEYLEDMLSNAIKAMSITLTNGTSSLTFTASKVRYRELGRPVERGSVVTQSINFYCELDTATGKTLDAVLVNTKSGYNA